MLKSVAHNIDNQHRTKDVYISENVDFTGMLLSQNVLEGLHSAGFKKPSPIQLKAIPIGLCGFDLIVQSKSGTGKTVIFSILALEIISISIKDPQVLILTPTREIAVQIKNVLKAIGSNIDDFTAEFFIGGLPIERDIEYLSKKSIHIAIGAPGRIKSLIEKQHLNTKNIKLFVLDEADKLMFDSFKDDIDFINQKLPQSKQIIATSATYTNERENLIAQYMKSPTRISVETDIPTLLGVKQFVSLITKHLNVVRQMQYKTSELTRILSSVPFKQCIVFTNYQIRAESLSNDLNKMGWPSTFIAGSQIQKERLEAIKKLKNHTCRLLISTDLIARGIDAEDVNLVINYDIPYDSATYLHRIGRAGRYGSLGLCITICCNGDEYSKFKTMLSSISTDIELLKLPSNESMPSNLWKCDKNSFEKVSVCNTVQNGNTSDTEGNLSSYKIQSDNILKISDLKADIDSTSGNDLNLNMEQLKLENEIINLPLKSSDKISKEIKTLTTDFGTPMPRDLSTTPNVIKIEKEKLKIIEKNIALLTISNLLINVNVLLEFKPFNFFEKLILNKPKPKHLEYEDLQNSVIYHEKNVNEICIDNEIYDTSKVINKKETVGFKSFSELKNCNHTKTKIDVVNSQFLDKSNLENENVLTVDSVDEIHDTSIATKETVVTENERNVFKSFSELQNSIVNRIKCNNDVINNHFSDKPVLESELIKIETKGFKSFESLKFRCNSEQNTDEIVLPNKNKETVNDSKLESINVDKNDFKTLTYLKNSSSSMKQTNDLNNVHIDDVNVSVHPQFRNHTVEKIDNIDVNNREVSSHQKVENNTAEKINTINLSMKNIDNTQANDPTNILINEITASNEQIVPKNITEQIEDRQKLTAEKKNIDKLDKTFFENTKIDDTVVNKLEYLLSLLKKCREIYNENKTKLKKVSYKILLHDLLNNKPVNLDNIMENNDVVRIIQSKVVIDSKSVDKSSPKKSLENSNINRTGNESQYQLGNGILKNSSNHSQYLPPKSETVKRYSDSPQTVDESFNDYSYNYFSNTQYVNADNSCQNCKCRYSEQENNRSQDLSNYYHTISNTSTSYDNYFDSWYNMWREQVIHVRNYVKRSNRMMELEKFHA